jgi:predicted nucleic acid-binding protein
MGLTYVIDTNIAIYHLDQRLRDKLPDGDYIVSVVTYIELLSPSWLDQKGEALVRDFLTSTIVADVDSAIRDEAIRLRRANGLKLPDSIIAATALTRGASLLTNDLRLLNLPSLGAVSLPMA